MKALRAYYNDNDKFCCEWLRNLIKAGEITPGEVDDRSIKDVQPADLAEFDRVHFFAGIAGWDYALDLASWGDQPVWTGSAPCQPYSSAGKGKGDSDDRNLWPVLFDLIRECRPQHIFGEQVEAAIRHGWLDRVSADLEGEGYTVRSIVLGAHSVGAPHIRQRLYWVASDNSQQRRSTSGANDSADAIERLAHAGSESGRQAKRFVLPAILAEGGWDAEASLTWASSTTCRLGNASNQGLQERASDGRVQRGSGQPQSGQAVELPSDVSGLGDTISTSLGRHTGDSLGSQGKGEGGRQIDGLSGIEPIRTSTLGNPWSNFDVIPCRDGKARRVEPGTFPLAHGVPGRVGRLRGYGNAIVPQVAAEFIQAYLETECELAADDAVKAVATETEFATMPDLHSSLGVSRTLDLSGLQLRGADEPTSLPQASRQRSQPDYHRFLASKRVRVEDAGFDVSEADLNPQLFPWQRSIVRWALRRGRAGVFPDTGLGKTFKQLVIAEQICLREGKNFLLLAPLAVGRQTMLEAKKFSIQVPAIVCSSQESVPDVAAGPHIVITNYEKLHKFDASQFVGVGLDEGSILKSIDGKTRDLLIDTFQSTPYRFVFTATPSPNDIMEIGSYCEFLGIMSRAEMLAMYFTHDGGDTAKWRLKGHAESEFVKWMVTWAVMLRKPSDIGYDDTGYDLPPLTIHEHVVETRNTPAGYLFTLEAKTLTDQRAARRETIDERVELAASLANTDPAEPWITWCNLNDESTAAAAAIQSAVEITGSQPDYDKEQRLIDFTEGLKRAVVTKPSIAGFGLNWQHCNKMTFLGLSHSYEQFYQAIRRIWRFGQQRPCDIHIIISDRDGAVLQNIHRKQAEADRLMNGMIAAMSEFTKTEIGSAGRQQTDYAPTKRLELPRWAHQ